MSVNAIYTIISTSKDPTLFLIARIARLTLASPALLLDVLDGLRSPDLKTAMYCAEAVEKISRLKLSLLTGYETEILTNFAMSPLPEVRGPLALVIPRLSLSEALKKNAVNLMVDYLKVDSMILRDRILVALAEVSAADSQVKAMVVPLLTDRLKAGEGTERTRARDLLAKLLGSRIPAELLM